MFYIMLVGQDDETEVSIEEGKAYLIKQGITLEEIEQVMRDYEEHFWECPDGSHVTWES